MVIALTADRAAPTAQVAAHDLVDDVAHLGELGAQVVVHVDEVLRHRELGGDRRPPAPPGRAARVGRAARLVPRQDAGQPGAVVGVGGPAGTAGGRSDAGSAGAQARWAGRHRRHVIRAPRRSRSLDEVAHRGGDLLAEAAHVVGVVGAEDVGGHALVEGQRGELLGPLRGTAAQEPPPEPKDPETL